MRLRGQVYHGVEGDRSAWMYVDMSGEADVELYEMYGRFKLRQEYIEVWRAMQLAEAWLAKGVIVWDKAEAGKEDDGETGGDQA